MGQVHPDCPKQQQTQLKVTAEPELSDKTRINIKPYHEMFNFENK